MKPGDCEVVRLLRWRERPGAPLRPLCAASGLVRVRGGFWAVADDLNHLIFLPDSGGPGRGLRVFPGEPPADARRRKRVKKDLESLIDLGDGRLVAFPSGSKHRRCRGVAAELDARGRIRRSTEVDFRPLMTMLGELVPDLNIEGGFVRRKRLVLLQRGNGPSAFNAVVKVRLKGFLRGLEGRWKRSALDLKVRRVPLGLFDRVPLAFTDGLLHDGEAYFAAAAEAGGDTVEDGEVAGSVIGWLPKKGEPVVLARVPGEKIEGIAVKRDRGGELEVWAVTDDDDPSRPSRLYRLAVAKAP